MFDPQNPRHVKLATTTRASHAFLVDREREALDVVYGDEENIGTRIKPFGPKENPEKLAWRRTVTVDHFENHGQDCGRTYLEQLGRAGKIVRQAPVDDALREWIDTRFPRIVHQDAGLLILGSPELYFYLDWPAGPRPYTMADQQQQKMWPRPSIVRPSAITRVVEDPDGEIDWIVRRMEKREDGKATEFWYEVRDAERIYALSAEGALIPELDDRGGPVSIVTHNIPGGSVVRAQYARNLSRGGDNCETCGQAFLHGVIRKTLACLQIVGMLAEAGYFHLNFDFYADVETLAALKQEGGRGNANAIPIPPKRGVEDDRIIPGYIKKDVSIIEMLAKWAFEWLPASIYRSARLRDRSSEKTANTSGISKMMDAVPEIAALAEVASLFQSIELQLLRRIVGAYRTGVDAKEITVTYPNRFIVKSETEIVAEIETVTTSMGLPGSPKSLKLLQELYRQYCDTALPDLPPADRKLVDAQLDEEPDEIEVEKPAIPGAPPFAPKSGAPFNGADDPTPTPATKSGTPPTAKPPRSRKPTS